MKNWVRHKGWCVANNITSQFILDNISIDTKGWCWNWTRGVNKLGYAYMKEKGKMVAIHRRSFELFRGPIPEGLVLDHLCRNPSCCNPDHLDPVTNSENRRRGVFADAKACKHGHEYTPENTTIQIDKRGHKSKLCRICRAERFRKYRATDPERLKATAVKSRAKHADKRRTDMRAWYRSKAGQAWRKSYTSTPEYKAKAAAKQRARRERLKARPTL